jgi:divalent metal cation (Fe/Co/Zn/Cd) transporter
MVIGLLLAATAFILAVETKGLLMGESAGRETRSTIRAAALAVPGVERIDRLLTMHLGPEEILVNMDLVVDPGLSEAEGEGVVRQVEEGIRRVVPEATRIFVELGPGG